MRIKNSGNSISDRFSDIFIFFAMTVILLSACQNKQTGIADEKEAKYIEIPQDYRYGWVTIPLKINGNKTIPVILDVSMPFDGLVIFHKGTIEELRLELPEGNAGKLADSVSLSVEGINLGKVVVRTFGEDRETSAFKVAGMIGKDVFNDYLLELDFDNALVKLHPYDSVPPGEGWYESKLTDDRGILYTDFVVGLNGIEARNVEVAIDMSGFSYYLRLKEKSGPGLDIPKHAMEAFLGNGITDDWSGYVFRAYSFRAGTFIMNGIITEMVNSDVELPDNKNGSIGLKFLKRFTSIFDFKNLKLYLKENGHFNDPYTYSMTGFNSRKTIAGTQKIVQIFDNSPATDAGVKLGDFILAVNGKPIQEYYYRELDSLYRQRGDTLKLTLLRNDNEIQKEIILRELF